MGQHYLCYYTYYPLFQNFISYSVQIGYSHMRKQLILNTARLERQSVNPQLCEDSLESSVFVAS